MFSQRKTEVFYGNAILRNFDVWYAEEKLLESMNCNAAPMWRFLCAKLLKKNVQVLEAEKNWRGLT